MAEGVSEKESGRAVSGLLSADGARKKSGAEFLGRLENRAGHSLSSQRLEIVGPQRLSGVGGSRGEPPAPATELWACFCTLAVRGQHNSETRPNMDVFTWESQCV